MPVQDKGEQSPHLARPRRQANPGLEPSPLGVPAAMAYVSLIVLDQTNFAANSPDPLERPNAWSRALEAAGHEVERLIVGGQVVENRSGWEGLASRGSGRSSDAVDALRLASGEIRVVVDGSRDYQAEDFPRLLQPLVEGHAEVALADGRPRGWRSLVALGLRPLSGSSDPFSGLIAVTRDALDRADEFKPCGGRFALEILARVRRKPAEIVVGVGHPAWPSSIGINDLRIVKRIIDDRLGNLSRLVQFCFVGASGMVVDLSSYALFLWLLARTSLAGEAMPTWTVFGRVRVGGVPADMALAAALAIALALTWNFTLNRALTFSYAKNGSILKQFFTYVLSNALGIALSYMLRLTLPRHFPFFADHKLAAALVGIASATGISFSMTRWLVFRPGRHVPETMTELPRAAETTTDNICHEVA